MRRGSPPHRHHVGDAAKSPSEWQSRRHRRACGRRPASEAAVPSWRALRSKSCEGDTRISRSLCTSDESCALYITRPKREWRDGIQLPVPLIATTMLTWPGRRASTPIARSYYDFQAKKIAMTMFARMLCNVCKTKMTLSPGTMDDWRDDLTDRVWTTQWLNGNNPLKHACPQCRDELRRRVMSRRTNTRKTAEALK